MPRILVNARSPETLSQRQLILNALGCIYRRNGRPVRPPIASSLLVS
jgi:hypothetical protein